MGHAAVPLRYINHAFFEQDLVNFSEAHPSIFDYFHNDSKLYVTFRKFNSMW